MNKKILIALIITSTLLITTAIIGFTLINKTTHNPQDVSIYLYPQEDYNTLKTKLKKAGVLSENESWFDFLANLKGLNQTCKSGHYVVKANMKQIDLVKTLNNGLQTPVKLIINKVRLKEDLAKKLSSQLMLSEQDILLAIDNTDNPNNIFDQIIPNTYEVYWNISAEKLIERLEKESNKWWQDKDNQLKRIGLSRHQVIVLASIVEEETNKNDEKPTIAGVYINRLNKDMLLQADPTVKYAVGDFTIKRVMYKHLQTESPYNTYLHKGLPPTAICLPTLSSINAVLNYQKHNYLFFCAKEDFSGYHNFATNGKQHHINAEKYRQALNRAKIF